MQSVPKAIADKSDKQNVVILHLEAWNAQRSPAD